MEDSAGDQGAGWIREIVLTNFMCHSYVKISLIKHVNFITGQNGSGKSAILTALCVAFGTKAKGTQRGNSLKDFIKTGESYATVEVIISNEGGDAYKADVYGPSIILERKLTTAGTSAFTLKDSRGGKVTVKRGEMEELASHFNIEVENPCIVMTQDKSREFLHSGSEKDKYKFFVKATLLEAVMSTMEIVWNNLKSGFDHIDEFKLQIRDVEEEVAELDSKLANFEEIQRTQETIAKWKKVLAWLHVREFDEPIKTLEKLADDCKKGIELFEAKIAAAKEDQEKADNAAREAKDLSTSATAKAEESRRFQQAIVEEASRAARERGRVLGEKNAKESRIRESEKRMAQLQRLVVEAQEKAAHDTQAEAAAREAVIAAKEHDITRITQDQERLKETLGEMEGNLDRVKLRRSDILRQIDCARSKESECNGWLRRLEEQAGNRMTAFGGRKVLDLLMLIERNEQHFDSPPIGPLGAHLSLLDDSYGLAVEVAIGQNFGSFAVTSQRDSKLLQQLGKQINYFVTTIVYSFDLPPIQPSSWKVPDQHFVTVEKVLNISHPVIRNVFIDVGHIEKTVLVRNYEDGKCAFVPGSRIKQCITQEGVRMFLNGGQEVILRRPSNVRTSRLRKDVEQDRRAAMNELESLKQQQRDLVTELHTYNRDMEEFQGPLREVKLRESKAERYLQKLRREIIDMRRQAEAEAAESAAVDLRVYLDEIEALKGDAEELRELLEKLEPCIHKLDIKVEDCKRRQNEISDKTKMYFDESDALEEKHIQLQLRIEEIKKEIMHHQKLLQQKQGELERIIQKKQATEEEQKICRRKASEYCDEPDPTDFISLPQSTQELSKKILEKVKETQEHQRQQGVESAEALRRKRDKKYKRLIKCRGDVGLLEGRFDLLKQALKVRKATLRDNMRCLRSELNWCFNEHLRRKGWSGTISIDYEAQTLTMDVKMPSDDSRSNVKDTRSLSGGERSFATLSYALALHDMVAAPFRAVDEFDIFMDNVTRKICLDEAVKFAIKNGSQWIFITPHDISSVEAGPFVKKQQMPSPRG